MLSYVARFNFYHEETDKINTKLYQKVGFTAMKAISKVRWNLRFFGAPWELALIDREYKKQSIAN